MKLILTADWHLRKDTPLCRLDKNWIGTQADKIKQIKEIAGELSIYHAGDLFHRSRVPQEIENMVADISMGILPGNHDFEHHSNENKFKSSLGVVSNFENIGLIESSPREMMFIHTLVFPNEAARPQIKDLVIGTTAEELLEKYPNVKWIFTGDYHRNFHYEKDGRHVINPGCLTRQAADFKDYEPGVYRIDTETEEVEFIKLKIDPDMVTDNHLKKEEERNERILAFVENIKNHRGVSLDFVSNLEKKKSGIKDPEDIKILDEILEVL
jgi:DNA repair exonuclease SbcCD nuclease subunit